MIGAVVFQLPIGWLADRFSGTMVMIGCGSFVAVACQFLPMVGAGLGLWVLCFLIGGVAFGLQTAVLTEMSNRFSGAMLVAGNVAIGIMAGGASMVGMPATGVAMELTGPSGYPMVIGAVFGGIALLYAAKALRARGGAAVPAATAAQAA
jgi:ethanolamine utilization microcompartment shell protein EutS